MNTDPSTAMEWYYANERDEQVPTTEQGLKALLDSGAINAETLIWREGMPDWQPCRAARPDWFGLPAAAPAFSPPELPPMRTASPPTDGLALTSMILGICSLPFSFCYGFGFFLGLAAVICGHLARKRLKRQSGVGGEGMALAGLITGYIAIVLGLLFVILIVFVFTAASLAPTAPPGS